MAHKANHYAINNASANNSQSSRAINEMGSLLGNMALGSDPSDDALFRQRLELAKKYKAETEGVGLKNTMLGMQNDATLQAGHEGYDNLQATNPRFSQALALALTENKKRPGILEKQGMMNQAMGMFLPRNPEEQDAAQWAALERGDMGPGGAGVGPKHTEGDLMRAFNLFSGKTTGAGDSFTMADKQGLRDATPKYTLTDTEKANQVKSVTDMLLGKNTAEIMAIQDESTEKQKLLQAQALGVASTTSATASKTGAQEGAITAESAETVNLLKQKVVKEQAATWVQRATERAIRTNTRNKEAESGQKILQLQAQTGVFGAQTNAIVASIANKDYESALKGMKIATEAMVTSQLGAANVEKITKQMEVLSQEVLNLQAEKSNKNSESTARVKLTDGKGGLVKEQAELVEDQQTQTQVETADGSELTKAKTDYWRTRGEGELSEIMTGKAGGGKKTGKSQFDYRKTKTAYEMQYDIEDVGQKFVVAKGASWNPFDGDETTYLWPDDYTAISNILVPAMKADDATKSAAMGKAQEELVKMGKTKPMEIHAIIKTIMQSTSKSK